MKLNFDTLASLIHGAQCICDKEGKIVIRRFSQTQLESLKDYKAGGKTRPTSVYLEFETDAESITLSYANVKTDANTAMFNFSLLENGVLTHHYAEEPIRRPKEEPVVTFPDGEVCFDLEKGWKKLTLYLPLMHLEIRALFLSDGARVVPVTRKGKMVAYGDSITEGFYSEVAGMSYFDQLCRKLDCEGANFAIGGSVFRPEYVPPNSVPECDRVIVAFGTNDFRHSPKELFHQRMPAFFKALFDQVKEKPVYVILPLWRAAEGRVFEYGDTLFAVRDAIAEEASRYPNAVILNGRELMPHAMAFMYDATHPNSLGHTHFAMNLAERILAHESMRKIGE